MLDRMPGPGSRALLPHWPVRPPVAVQASSVNPCAAIGDRMDRQRCRVEAARQLQHDWVSRLAFGPERGRARLVQLWTGIFAVSWRQLAHPWLGRYPSLGQLDSRGDLIAGLAPDALYRQVLQSLWT